MGQSDVRGAVRAGTGPGSTQPIALRMLRTEAVYRQDTRNLDRTERDRYSNFLWNVVRLDLGPKVRLADLVGTGGAKPLNMAQEDDLSAFVDFYSTKDARQLLPVLQFFAAYLMQQARQAKDQRRQLFLVFKAVDVLRMIVQYSPLSISYPAETVVSGIFADLGGQLPQRFAAYHDHQTRIRALMRRLHHAPNDHSARAQLAEAYARQTSLFDAFVQYQTLLRLLPPTPIERDRRKGLVYVRTGGLFQGLADMKLAALQDGRKLRNFIERFNREQEGRDPIPALKGTDAAALGRVQRGFRALANRAYTVAIKVQSLDPEVLLSVYTHLGRNLLAEGRSKEAAAVLTEGNRHYRTEPDSLAAFDERVRYLAMLSDAAARAGSRELGEKVLLQLADAQRRRRDLEAAQKEKQKRRAEILARQDD
jgi:hypothetical protein